ncbi:arginine deiminase family protein [Bacillus licheniformis]|nr:arginine deiminase family protein [Bacillus licheniformis]
MLKRTLGLSDVNLIFCGGGDEIASAREQWNDGSNTLAIAPGLSSPMTGITFLTNV